MKDFPDWSGIFLFSYVSLGLSSLTRGFCFVLNFWIWVCDLEILKMGCGNFLEALLEGGLFTFRTRVWIVV